MLALPEQAALKLRCPQMFIVALVWTLQVTFRFTLQLFCSLEVPRLGFILVLSALANLVLRMLMLLWMLGWTFLHLALEMVFVFKALFLGMLGWAFLKCFLVLSGFFLNAEIEVTLFLTLQPGLARCRVGVCRRETRKGPSGR